MGARRIAFQRIGVIAIMQASLPVQRTAETIQYPAEPSLRGAHARRFRLQINLGPGPDTFQRAERHHQGGFAPEADNFTFGKSLGRFDSGMRTQREARLGALGFDEQTIERTHAAFQHAVVQALNAIDQGLHHYGMARLSNVRRWVPVRAHPTPQPVALV